MNGSPPRVARGRCTRCLIRRYPRQEQHHQKSHRSASGLIFEVAEALFVLSSDTELVFADDQRFRGPSPAGTGHNINGVTGLFVILPVIPTHERQLRFAGKFDGERLELVFDNPAFGTASSDVARGIPATDQDERQYYADLAIANTSTRFGIARGGRLDSTCRLEDRSRWRGGGQLVFGEGGNRRRKRQRKFSHRHTFRADLGLAEHALADKSLSIPGKRHHVARDD